MVDFRNAPICDFITLQGPWPGGGAELRASRGGQLALQHGSSGLHPLSSTPPRLHHGLQGLSGGIPGLAGLGFGPGGLGPGAGVEVGIFWDYENCSLRGGEDCALAVRCIRDVARHFGQLRCLRAYFKPDGLSVRMGELLNCGVDVCPVAAGKEMADKAILTDALLFALDASERRHHGVRWKPEPPPSPSRLQQANLSERGVLTVVVYKRRRGGTGAYSSYLKHSAEVALEWYDLAVMEEATARRPSRAVRVKGAEVARLREQVATMEERLR
eukprot:jgi/Mesen1/1915/ME000143S00962